MSYIFRGAHMKEQMINFKAKDKEYELFFAEDDDQIELYDKNNPKDGFYFKNKKELLMFMNTLTDVLEKMEMEHL